MKTIVSRSIPFKDVMSDLSKEMETTFSNTCEEYCLKIPPHIGKGQIRGINFGEGIGMLLYDCTFNVDTEIKFIVNKVHPLKFIYCEEGQFVQLFEKSDEEHQVDELQNIIVASPQHNGHILRFRAGVRTKINNIEIDRKKFYETMACEINNAQPDIKALLEDLNAEQAFFFQGSYSLKTADVFNEMNDFVGQPFEKNIFIHSKTYEILNIQLMEYHDAQLDGGQQSVLLKREVDSIYKASKIIDENLASMGTIQELAREVGLNVNKLQAGFKSIFNTTVNGYIQDRRLLEASSLIKNTDLSFSEIAYKVGISSKSYFSKIFRDRYGKTPSEIRARMRGQSSKF
ncbi:MAG TPA: AraC family transcriptional regulator [Flavobacteriaceae bacterium]|nr:AraC family transcriptional regulator [Flavobacteriaceae bacterium]